MLLCISERVAIPGTELATVTEIGQTTHYLNPYVKLVKHDCKTVIEAIARPREVAHDGRQ